MELNRDAMYEIPIPQGLFLPGKRASTTGVEAALWIANNDNDGSGDSAEEISGYISSCLVADVFNMDRDLLGQWIRDMRTAAGLD